VSRSIVGWRQLGGRCHSRWWMDEATLSVCSQMSLNLLGDGMENFRLKVFRSVARHLNFPDSWRSNPSALCGKVEDHLRRSNGGSRQRCRQTRRPPGHWSVAGNRTIFDLTLSKSATSNSSTTSRTRSMVCASASRSRNVRSRLQPRFPPRQWPQQVSSCR
jgi:hypothetical protein